MGVGEDITITAVYKGDAPAQTVTWQSRTPKTTTVEASAWKDLAIDNLKLTTSAIQYDTNEKTSASTLVVNDVNSDDEKDYRAVGIYKTGDIAFEVETNPINIIIKCKYTLLLGELVLLF